MKLGAYDQKIEFIKFGNTPDGAGGYDPVEESLLTTFAQIKQLKQSGDLEKVYMGLPTAYRVKVIARSGFSIVVGMLIRWRGVVYQILSAPDVDSVRLQKEWIFDIGQQGNG
ncbi:head-tail adaptor protein [Sphingobacterium psychroaquaticum]|uniref:head-tail adaptor protein n=1 Tax=Sphingobacterium psychroaquaticum TaxID=561061 RepID=UPI00106A3559|nr:head-tail adaptor protein [Sphingobacterium psychroaquaticum]QBQ41078.1 head-tail adaptor protein [Sphingobacterium psychroaquaticum]